MAQSVNHTKLLRDTGMGFDALRFYFATPRCMGALTESGGILAVEIIAVRRKYNRLLLDGVCFIGID